MRIKDIDGWNARQILFKEPKILKALIISVKEIFPNLYDSGKEKGWSDWKIINYISEMDIPNMECAKILEVARRAAKMAAFI